jgi:hypothetical protein
MSDKDLGELTDNLEERLENLQHTEMRIMGVKMTPATIMGAIALVGSILGTLYGGFETYKAFQEMSEKLEVMDIEAVEARNVAIERKLDDAIDYTRDIKNSLRDDLIAMEGQVDRVEDDMRELENRLRVMIREAQTSFDNKRDRLQTDYDNRAQRLQDRSDSEIKDLRAAMEQLEKELEDKLQKALDNPLSDN